MICTVFSTLNKGLLKVTGNHVHAIHGICGRPSISETVQDKSRCYCRPLIENDIWPIEERFAMTFKA